MPFWPPPGQKCRMDFGGFHSLLTAFGSPGKSKNPQKGPIVLRLSILLSGFGFAPVFSLVPGDPRRRCDWRRVRGYRPRTVLRASGISFSGIKSHLILYEFQGNGCVIKGGIPQKRPRKNLFGFSRGLLVTNFKDSKLENEK